MTELSNHILDEVNPEKQLPTYSYTSVILEGGLLALIVLAFYLFATNSTSTWGTVIGIFCLLIGPVFYLVNTFNKPYFNIPEKKKTRLGIWNVVNLFALAALSFLPVKPFLYIFIMSPIAYFATLAIWEARATPTKKPLPIVLFHVGIIGLILYVCFSPLIDGQWLFRLFYVVIGIEILSFLWMLFYVLSDKRQYGAFIFYFPRQLAFLLVGIIIVYNALPNFL